MKVAFSNYIWHVTDLGRFLFVQKYQVEFPKKVEQHFLV